MSMPAEFDEIAKRVNNWGRWGADDEIGTLNLITDEVVREAAATVRTGRRIPLALPLQQDGVQTGMIPGRVNPLHAMVQINQEIFGPGTVACSDDAVTMGLQAATHWDALPHVSHSGRLYNGRPASTVTPHGGAEFSGIDKARHGRAVRPHPRARQQSTAEPDCAHLGRPRPSICPQAGRQADVEEPV